MDDMREAPKHGDKTGTGGVLIPMQWRERISSISYVPPNGRLRQRTRSALRTQITWPPMSLSKYFRTVAAALAILAQPALACSFNISFNSHFGPGADRLPASEVRRMAEWMIDSPGKYENKEEFHIALYEAPAFGVSHVLARKRTAHLTQLLTTFGVPASMISMEIARHNPGKSLVPNFANIDFMPGCPHPCCPGPEPTSQIR